MRIRNERFITWQRSYLHWHCNQVQQLSNCSNSEVSSLNSVLANLQTSKPLWTNKYTIFSLCCIHIQHDDPSLELTLRPWPVLKYWILTWWSIYSVGKRANWPRHVVLVKAGFPHFRHVSIRPEKLASRLNKWISCAYPNLKYESGPRRHI